MSPRVSIANPSDTQRSFKLILIVLEP